MYCLTLLGLYPTWYLAGDSTTTKNAKSTKEEKLPVEIFFFESNDPFFVAFVRFVVKN